MLQEAGCCRTRVGPPLPLPSPQGEAGGPGLSSAVLPRVSSTSSACPAASQRGQYPSRARPSRALPTSPSRQQPRNPGPRGWGPAGTPPAAAPTPVGPAAPSSCQATGEVAGKQRGRATIPGLCSTPERGRGGPCHHHPLVLGTSSPCLPPAFSSLPLDFGLSTGVAVAAVRLPALAEPQIASAVRPAPRPRRGTAGNVGDVPLSPVPWGGCERGLPKGMGPSAPSTALEAPLWEITELFPV